MGHIRDSVLLSTAPGGIPSLVAAAAAQLQVRCIVRPALTQRPHMINLAAQPRGAPHLAVPLGAHAPAVRAPAALRLYHQLPVPVVVMPMVRIPPWFSTPPIPRAAGAAPPSRNDAAAVGAEALHACHLIPFGRREVHLDHLARGSVANPHVIAEPIVGERQRLV